MPTPTCGSQGRGSPSQRLVLQNPNARCRRRKIDAKIVCRNVESCSVGHTGQNSWQKTNQEFCSEPSCSPAPGPGYLPVWGWGWGVCPQPPCPNECFLPGRCPLPIPPCCVLGTRWTGRVNKGVHVSRHPPRSILTSPGGPGKKQVQAGTGCCHGRGWGLSLQRGCEYGKVWVCGKEVAHRWPCVQGRMVADPSLFPNPPSDLTMVVT